MVRDSLFVSIEGDGNDVGWMSGRVVQRVVIKSREPPCDKKRKKENRKKKTNQKAGMEAEEE
jgi:hypothetical protein